MYQEQSGIDRFLLLARRTKRNCSLLKTSRMRSFWKLLVVLSCCTALSIIVWSSQPGPQIVHTGSVNKKACTRGFLSRVFHSIWTSPDSETCPDILSGMARGAWTTRSLSKQEQSDIDSYLQEERMAYNIPINFQRLDGRCGNVTYDSAPLHRHMWFKAICDRNGFTPCCRENRCVPARQQDCRCPDCYDERQTVHAEYSQWVPADKRCAVKTFSAEEACSVLRGANLEFVGDSFVRHMFAATVILLSGQEKYAALQDFLPPNIRHICRGMHQFTAIQCRDYLNETRSLCNNTVQMRYTQTFPSTDFVHVPPVLKRTASFEKSLLVMSLGIHDDFKFETVKTDFLLPVLNLRQHMASVKLPQNDSDDGLYLDLGDIRTNFTQPTANSTLESLISLNGYDEHFFERMKLLIDDKFLDTTYMTFLNFGKNKDLDARSGLSLNQEANDNTKSGGQYSKAKHKAPVVFQKVPDPKVDHRKLSPKMLWVGIHAPGLLKASKFTRQTAQGVSDFNQKVSALLEQWKIPFMDTFSFTNGTVSFDGTHYGWGVNMLKANMLVRYVQEDLVGSKHWR